MHLDFFISNDSVASYDLHRKTTFFRGASVDSLSFTKFSIFFNENLGKYCSNVALSYGLQDISVTSRFFLGIVGYNNLYCICF